MTFRPIAVAVALAALGCPKKQPSSVIGPAGGTVASADGAVKLVFPPGALAAATPIGIAPHTMGAADADLIPGTSWDFTPAGAHFAQPVQAVVRWSPSSLPAGADPSRIALVHRLDDGRRMIVDGFSLDLAGHVASGTLNGFSGVSITLCVTACPLQPQLSASYLGNGVMELTFHTVTPFVLIQRAPADSALCTSFLPDGYRVCDAAFADLEWDAVPQSGAYQDVYQSGVAVFNYRIAECWDRTHCSPWSNIAHVLDSFGSGTGGPTLTLSASAISTNEIDLTWNAVAGADHFTLEGATGGPSGYVALGALNGTTYNHTSFGGTALVPGTTYYYRLTAYSVSGVQLAQALASATTNTPAGTGANVTVTWTLYGQGASVTQCNLAAPFGEVSVKLSDTSGSQTTRASCSDGILHFSAAPGAIAADGTLAFGAAIGGQVASTQQATGTVAAGQTLPVNIDFHPLIVAFTTWQELKAANASWVVARNGSDAWQQLTGSAGHYWFSSPGGRYSIAAGCVPDSVQHRVLALELTTSDTVSPAVRCDDPASRVGLSGSLANIPASHCATGRLWDFSFGPAGTDSACGGAIGYSAQVLPGTYDVVVSTYANDDLTAVPDKVLIDPGVPIAGPTLHNLDLAAAVDTQLHAATIVPGSSSVLSAKVSLHTRLNTESVLGHAGAQSASFNFGGVPSGSPGNGIHELEADVAGQTQSEILSVYFTAPADQVADFSTPMPFGPSVTLDTVAPYPRPQAAFAAVTGAAGYQITYVLSNTWTTFVSAAWLAAAGGSTGYQLPDLNAPGFQFPAAFGLAQGSISWRSSAYVLGNGTVDTLLRILAQHTETAGDGLTVRSATVTGSADPPPVACFTLSWISADTLQLDPACSSGGIVSYSIWEDWTSGSTQPPDHVQSTPAPFHWFADLGTTVRLLVVDGSSRSSEVTHPVPPH